MKKLIISLAIFAGVGIASATVSTTNTRHVYNGDGLQINWPYTFTINAATDIKVYTTNPSGVITLLSSNYLVDTTNSRVVYPSTGSGLSPLATGWKITLLRDKPLTQPISLTNQGQFSAKALERGLDNITMMTQQMQGQLDRAVKYPVDTSVSSATDVSAFLEDYTNFRGSYYGAQSSNPTVDPNGNPIAGGDFYFNSTFNELRFYNNTTWYAIQPWTVNDDMVSSTAAIQSNKLDYIYTSTDSVHRSVESRLRDFVTIQDFGGVADDGLTDNCTAFRKANAYISQTKGVLYIPPSVKRYDTSEQITPSSFTAIIGAGKNMTKIRYSGTSYWLLDASTFSTKQNFLLQGMSIETPNGLGVARIGDPNQTVFSEGAQKIDYYFKDLYILGNTTYASIIPNSHALQLTQLIRAHIEDNVILGYSVGLNLKKFDEGWVTGNRVSFMTTYAVYVHNDMNDKVADETIFDNNSFGVPNANSISVYLYQVQNLRMRATYIESTASSVNTAYKLNNVYNVSIDGGTIGSVDTLFNIIDGRGVIISNVGLQDANNTLNQTSTVTYRYNGATDDMGSLGPIGAPNFGLIKVQNCAQLIMDSFKNIPMVSLVAPGKYGPGESHFGRGIGDVSHVYATQVLDRNGVRGLLKETGMVIAPFAANTYFNGVATTEVVVDTNTSTGFALLAYGSPGRVVNMNIPYSDLVPGCYDIVANVKSTATFSSAFWAVYWDNVIKENYSNVTLRSTYTQITAGFCFNPTLTASTNTISFKMENAQNLYIDYAVFRPAANSSTFQLYQNPNQKVVGTAAGSTFHIFYGSTATISGCSVGDIAFSTSPVSGSMDYARCGTSGSPGTWLRGPVLP